MSVEQYMTEEIFQVVFSQFNHNKDGLVSMDCITKTFEAHFQEVDLDQIRDFLNKYDKDGDGFINESEFREMLYY